MHNAIRQKMKRDGIKGTKAIRNLERWYHPDLPLELRCPFHGVHLIGGGTCPICKRQGRQRYDFSSEELIKAEAWKRNKRRPIIKKLPRHYPKVI